MTIIRAGAGIHEQAPGGGLLGTLVTPEACNGLGVIVLAGSSGRVDGARARLFAARGAVALALQWFGGEGQVPGICEVPLETFFAAVDRLAREGCERIAFIGTSRGAEAAVLAAIHDQRVDAVAAVSPSSIVWGNTGPGLDGVVWPQRSSWTRAGVPLPFVASDPYWKRAYRDGLLTYRSLFEQSLLRFAPEVEAATIAVEAARARMIFVAGGDDALWPSEMFARSMVERLAAFGKSARLVFHPEAGHRVLLPGEVTPRSTLHAHGGNDQADRALGRGAWDAILEGFGLPA
jgi:pimeloyl-ACP methyl ester carboxylesterase